MRSVWRLGTGEWAGSPLAGRCRLTRERGNAAMKVIRGGRDALREEILTAVLNAILHDRPEDLERARALDQRLAHRGQLRLVQLAADDPSEPPIAPARGSD